MSGWRIHLASVLVALGAATAPAQERDGLHHQERPEASPILAFYDFEQPTPSGPDTFWVRQRGGNEIDLSDAFRVSGERSLNISEVEGNRDFAEFLAYFDERREGDVYIQLYLLLTDPEQRFNFGLAGTDWFLSTDRHGQAVWLQTDRGVFRHRTHEGWRQLFAPRPFVWHFIDIVYRVADGTYALRIREEGNEEPLVDLRRVRSMHGRPDSWVRYFSLIGDLEDAGRFDFFVDDLMIATHPSVLQQPFVAPGRRRYFVDMLPAPDSVEAEGDQAFRAGDLVLAKAIYDRLQHESKRRTRILLKLADIEHVEGNVDAERQLREQIYGRLDFE